MTEVEWLRCSNLQSMLAFVRSRATLHKMLAFAAAFDVLLPSRRDHEHPQETLEQLDYPGPIAQDWDHKYLIESIMGEVLWRSSQPQQQGDLLGDACDLLRDIFIPFQVVKERRRNNSRAKGEYSWRGAWAG